MLTIIFVICAALGGAILIVQFVLALVGFGAHSLHIDVPGHFDGDAGGDVHFGGDFHTGDLHGDADVHDGLHRGDLHGVADAHDGLHPSAHHFDSTWLFTVISFRTVVAAMAFFGLAGLAASSAGVSPAPTLGIAVVSGLAAMFAVYGLMRALMSLRAEGTAHITNAVGRVGTVYTTIPAEGGGSGKIQLNLQGRTMEYLAVTPGDALKPGTEVVVRHRSHRRRRHLVRHSRSPARPGRNQQRIVSTTRKDHR